MIKPAYCFSFLLSINIFLWQNVLYFLDAPRRYAVSRRQGSSQSQSRRFGDAKQNLRVPELEHRTSIPQSGLYTDYSVRAVIIATAYG